MLAKLVGFSVSKLTATFVLLAFHKPLPMVVALSSNKTILQSLFSTGQDAAISSRLTLHTLTEPVGSTQDEARRRLLLESHDPNKCLAVIATEQTQGRGTQGRKWEGGNRKGNLYLSVCVPMDRVPVKITLFPLKIAVLVAERVSRLIAACQSSDSKDVPKTTVKWPNDVLVNENKISGTLIENAVVDGTTWLIVGIGVNVAFAPNLTESPGKQVRGATCIQDHCQQALSEETAVAFGTDLASALADWVMQETPIANEANVIDQWKSFAEFGKLYELRGEIADENRGHYTGEVVMSVDIMDDGQLLVRGENGRERLLIAEYMF